MKSCVPLSSSRRLSRGFGAALLAVAVVGCAPSNGPDSMVSTDLDGFRTRHPIVVEEGRETLDLPVGAHTTRLPGALVSAIEGFGRSARAAGAGSIVMMVPSGSYNEQGIRHASREVVAALGRAGFGPRAIERRSYPAEGPEDAAPIRLSYARVIAHVQHACGQWPEQALPSPQNRDYWNFGCATQANMAAMAANPTDLVAPSQIGTPDATRRAGVLAKYRKGEKTMSDFGLPAPGVSSISGGGSQ